MQQVLIADPIDKKAQQMLVDAGFEVNAPKEPAVEEVMSLISEYDILVVRSRTRVTKEMIEEGKKLKVIGRAGVGVDTIDAEEAERRGIKVFNAPGSNSRSVAEHAVGLMCALARLIPQADKSMKEGKWEKKLFKGTELQGKTVGILGYGNVGKMVASLVKGLGMEPLVWTRSPKDDASCKFANTLDELLSSADIVTVHVPKTKETGYLLGSAQFARMKEGVFLVHTARGGIVDEDALLQALASGKVKGAALDVFENEPSPRPQLVAHPRVIATPHIAAATVEAQARAGTIVAEQIIAWARGSL